MPHLSQLARDYSDKHVTVIGLTSADKNNTLDDVREMVEDKGDEMDYTVAWDVERKTNEAYMKASNQRGIPTSFLVDKAGKIAWIGHPMSADIPLAHVVADTWDYDKGPAMMEQISEDKRAMRASARTDPGKALTLLKSFRKQYPLADKGLESLHFSILARLPKHVTEATKLGRSIVEKAVAEKDPMGLNAFAWNLVDPEAEFEHRFLDLAQLAAGKAEEFSGGKDGAILDTVARVHYWRGDFEQAIEVQRRAVEHSEGRMKEALREVLQEYEEASEGKRSV